MAGIDLGSGAYGEVQLDDAGNARKVFKKRRLKNVNEIAMLKFLEGCPFVVELVAVDFPRSFTMPQGVCLTNLLATGLDPGLVVGHILSALQYLHDICGIVHRDVTAGNVLLREDRYVLCDMGKSIFTSVAGSEILLSGVTTPDMYRSPTLVNGTTVNSVQAKATDIWGCGVILAQVRKGKIDYACAIMHELSPKENSLVTQMCSAGAPPASELLQDSYFGRVEYNDRRPRDRMGVHAAPGFKAPICTRVLFYDMYDKQEWCARKVTAFATACNLYRSGKGPAEACLYLASTVIMHETKRMESQYQKECEMILERIDYDLMTYVPSIPEDVEWDWDTIKTTFRVEYVY